MNNSIALASVTLALAATACGGFTEVGQGGAGGGSEAGSSGATHRGGSTSGGASTGGASSGGAGSCKTDDNCPEVGLCAPCADDSCAEPRCLDGKCQLSCDAGATTGGAGGGSCSAEHGSCANGETCCAGLECCAGVPVPPGNEYCGIMCPESDQNIKRDFLSVDPNQVLDQLSRLPIGTWSYRAEGSTQRHIGPMAQDFKAAFNVGSSDRTILQVDADGVAFAAIQALNARLTALEQQNQQLQQQLEEQRVTAPCSSPNKYAPTLH